MKRELHAFIRAVAEGGIPVCATSGEMEELAAVCDRVICMYGGQIVGEVNPRHTADAEAAIVHLVSHAPAASGSALTNGGAMKTKDE